MLWKQLRVLCNLKSNEIYPIMVFQPRVLKLTALTLWGCLIFLIIYNQRINLEYLQEEKTLVLRNNQYQFSERGNETSAVSKYRKDRGKGHVLFGYSQEETFVSSLSFYFKKPTNILFRSQFSRTKSCHQGIKPSEVNLYLNVNDSEYLLQSQIGKFDELMLEVSADDQITIHAEATQGACGAVLLKMAEVRKLGDFSHYLLLNILWGAFILLMLACGRIALPLLSICIFYIFQKAELLYSPFLVSEQLLMFSSLAITVSLLLSLFSSFFKNRFLGRSLVSGFSFLLVALTCFLPLIALGFDEVFNVKMSKYDWFAILQSNLNETIEFITVFASGHLVMKIIALIVFLLLFLFFTGKKQARYRPVHWLVILLLGFIVWDYHGESNLISNTFAAISEYNQDLVRLEEKEKQREKRIEHIQADKQHTDEVYVVIIGESANRNHFALYGYPRSTNPRLVKRHQNDDLIRFDQSYSGGVSTLGTLKYSLTSATIKNGDPGISPTIMEVLNRAGFYTYWLHNGNTSVARNLVGLIGEQALHTDSLSPIYGTEDGKLLPELDKILTKDRSKSKVIFFKTQGSHVDYCKRLPDIDEWTFDDVSFEKWMIPDKYEVTRLSSQMKKCYDGTVKYTDYFVDEVINRVQQTGKIASVIYFSDHGEEIVEGTAHMGKIPTYGVFSIPMFIWFSDGYKQRYPTRYKNTAANAKKVFVNDAMFDSLLGLMAVDYNGITAGNNISSEFFKNGKYIFRGRKTVYDSDNYIYNTPRNLAEFRKNTHPYSVYVGPLEHPFHLTWVTGENHYDQLVLAATYQNSMFELDSPLYRKSTVALSTVLRHLQPHPERKLFFRLKVDVTNDNNISAIVNHFLGMIKTHEINREDLIVASDNPAFLDALKAQDIQISYLATGIQSKANIEQYDSITVDHSQLTNIPDGIGDKPIDVWVSTCHINSCDRQFFENLDELAEKTNIRRIVLPMFDL